MKGDQVEKNILYADGEEIAGLVQLDEYEVSDTTVSIPGRDKTVPVRNGVKIIPEIGGTFKVKRGTNTLKFLQDWYTNREYKEVVLVRTDGAGNEFSREIWPNTELRRVSKPAYDASAPAYAQVGVTFLPEDILPVDATA